MYARSAAQPRRARRAETKTFPAPTQGWIANRSLADPRSFQDGAGAAILDNFFPKATSVVLRRGKQPYASFADETLPVTALFTYRDGANERFFGANETTIYDLTTVPFPGEALVVTDEGDSIDMGTPDVLGWGSTDGLEVSVGNTSGDWVTAQFAATGTTYLIGVNGMDAGFLFDGVDFYPYVVGGVRRLNFDTQTANFIVGETLTGATSGATGTIWKVVDSGTSGHLLLTGVTGAYADNETITGATAGSAKADGVLSVAAPGPAQFGTSGLTTADMAYVWVYKNRLWFVEKDSMNAWYAEGVDSVGGNFAAFPLAGVFGLGGALYFGAPWSLDGAGIDGLSEQNVFVSSLGEVAVYQGNDPASADTWAKVGLFRVGRPLGREAFIRGGGDLAIATTVGLVPLSKAISLDVTALNVATVSYRIGDAWTEAVTLRGSTGWHCGIWPEAKMAVISPPDLIGSTFPVVFVSNTETGAWARYTGWQALCLAVFRGQLFFGSPEGKVFIANAGGDDFGETFTGVVAPLFEDMGNPASAKVAGMARARVRANTKINASVSALFDFDTSLPAPPDATVLTTTNAWGTAIWGTSIWGEATPSIINQDWQSVGGAGYAMSPAYQVTSGSVAPIDAELIDLQMTFTATEVLG